MNTKQIMAIAAIVAVALAGIAGAAYAYQATLTNSLNNVESNYLELNTSGDFSGTFSETNLQWDMDTTAANTGTYVPAGTLVDIARGLKGLAINDTVYTITINSESMEAGNWFKFQVKTVSANDASTAVDMNGAYAMKYIFSDGTNTYTDYNILTGTTDVPLFMSSVSKKTGVSVQLQLFAIPVKDAAIPNNALDYRFVDFIFSAQTMDNAGTVPAATADGISLTVTAANGSTKVTDLTADTARLYSAAGARVCVQANITGASTGLYKFTAPATDAGTALSFKGDTGDAKEYTAGGTGTALTLTGKYTSLTYTIDSGAAAAVKAFTFSISSADPDYTTKDKITAAIVAGLNFKAHFGDLDTTGEDVDSITTGTWTTDNLDLGAHKVTFTYTVGETSKTADFWIYLVP